MNVLKTLGIVDFNNGKHLGVIEERSNFYKVL